MRTPRTTFQMRIATVASAALALTLAGSLAIPVSAQASGERGRCADMLTDYRSTMKAFNNDRISADEASTRLAKLVDTARNSHTAEAMLAARSLIRQGSDVPEKIDKLIKRRLGNDKC